jgi:histidinol-phosphate phosphatase family protein
VSPGGVDVVVPTVGRSCLRDLLDALAACRGPRPGRVLVVDDRRPGARSGLGPPPGWLRHRLQVVPGPAAGPAAARNRGWRASTAPWVAFLDDDVVPEPDWLVALAADLDDLPPGAAASQGRIRVPVPRDRRPTDRERCVAGLETARWATADMAYRRAALAAVGGFDERFPRAYREDADLGLRLQAAGYGIVAGRRRVVHPVRPDDRWASVRLQRGNADDAVMRALHGRGWRALAGAPQGRRSRHLAIVAAAATAIAAGALGRRRLARVAAIAWFSGTAELAWARIAPGPRTRDEITTMLATSAAIPPAAVCWWLAGLLRSRRLAPSRAARPEAVLLDRDGTIVVDVPYNADPERVTPMEGARAALDRLRAAGVPTAVVTNQSGVARGLLSRAQATAVNRRIEDLLGPLGPWAVCPHGPGDGCDCRKPAPGLVLRAAAALGADPRRCVVIGDIGADVQAALAAGARPIMVPTEQTLPHEVSAAPEVARDLADAVARVLGT